MLPKHEKRCVRKCVRTHEVWDPLPLYAAARFLDDRPSPDQLRTYLIDYPYLNQKTYQDIRIPYSLEQKHSKKQISLRKTEW